MQGNVDKLLKHSKTVVYAICAICINVVKHEKTRIENPRVGGSIPPQATRILKGLAF